ncbi:hydroxyisourate hydrolase [Phytohabitans flavus]
MVGAHVSISVKAQDAVHGQPAAGVRVRLERAADGVWIPLAQAETDRQGCVRDWYEPTSDRHTYRLTLNSDHYFTYLGFTTAYPEVAVTFRVLDETRSHQVEVLLSPNSYTAYLAMRE